MVNPKKHPNASMALMSGYAATVLIYGAKKLGVDLTVEEASAGASALIGLALFLGKKIQ